MPNKEKFYGKMSSKKAKNAYNRVKFIDSNFSFPPAFKQAFTNDPKWILFNLSRYKFVSKMLEGKNTVLEIGCWDGACSILVAKNVKKLVAIDYYKEHIKNAKKYIENNQNNIKFIGSDFLDFDEKLIDKFDAIYSIDVLEHIDQKQEKIFFENIKKYLKKDGVALIGTPSKESQKYASKGSKESHINCKSGKELKRILQNHFENNFLFSMNDEVIHTGFEKMAHYLFCLSANKK